MSEQNCCTCKNALAVDAARDLGVITEDCYQSYLRSETPIGGSARAICKVYDRFIAWEESCESWVLRTDGKDFERL